MYQFSIIVDHLVYQHRSLRIHAYAAVHDFVAIHIISMVATGTCTCTTYLLLVVLFRWHSSVYLASQSTAQVTRFRTLPIPLPFSNPFLFWLCLILSRSAVHFFFWFARLLDDFHSLVLYLVQRLGYRGPLLSIIYTTSSTRL